MCKYCKHIFFSSIYLFALGVSFLITLCCYAGLLVYAELGSCDPLGSGLVKADDQMLPVYVMQATKNIPGAAGLFVAGVFGAALRFVFHTSI